MARAHLLDPSVYAEVIASCFVFNKSTDPSPSPHVRARLHLQVAQLHKNGKLKEAEQKYLDCLKGDANDHVALHGLAVLKYQLYGRAQVRQWAPFSWHPSSELKSEVELANAMFPGVSNDVRNVQLDGLPWVVAKQQHFRASHLSQQPPWGPGSFSGITLCLCSPHRAYSCRCMQLNYHPPCQSLQMEAQDMVLLPGHVIVGQLGLSASRALRSFT
jgi:hypothetical protein